MLFGAVLAAATNQNEIATGLDTAATTVATIGVVLSIILAIAALILAVFWIIFPWMVYSKLNVLIKVIETANRNLQEARIDLHKGFEALDAKLIKIASLLSPKESNTLSETERVTVVSPVVVGQLARKAVHGSCTHCGGGLEFDSDHAGETISCPHCGRETALEPNQ